MIEEFTIIVVSGTRRARETTEFMQIIERVLDEYARAFLYHGGQRGIDKMAGGYALRRGWGCIPVIAEWKRYGDQAGPIRNGKMLRRAKRMAEERCAPIVLHAFPDELSTGTWNCVKQAKVLEIPWESHEVPL